MSDPNINVIPVRTNPEGRKNSLELREIDDFVINPNGEVDIQKAVYNFDVTRQSLETPRAKSNRSFGDIEKGDTQDPATEQFDLRAFFEDSVRQGQIHGQKLKRVGVTFENLTVVGQGADASRIPDNLSPLKMIAKLLWPPNWFNRNEGSKFEILHDISGFCKDGEMLLVLGRPGAGCSSLLRMIANQRANYLETKGEVLYGGIPAKDFEKFAGEAIYIPEEDMHFPSLTVRQALDFALKMKTPGNRLPDTSRAMFRENLLNLLLKMFGLTKQIDTVTGDAFIRGLSGGERKRLTIAEAMVSQGCIDCWDCSTRGLDSASALDYAKSLRIISDTMRKTTVATFYQASEAIYQLFDRVIVLDKGRCIYFGPVKEAKQYFLDLGFECEPRKSTADFLTGVTNFQERIIRKGCEDTTPTTSFALEAAWKKSEAYQNALADIKKYKEKIASENPSEDFRKQVRESKGKLTPKKSLYTVNVFTQTLALLVRQFQIVKGNRPAAMSRYVASIIMALIYGSSYYHMPLTAVGGYTRGGAIFGALLFNSMLTQSELFGVFIGRTVISKQKSFAFYHPGLLAFSQTLLDIPIQALQTLLFSAVVYWMYGLDNTAEKFFIFWGTLTLTTLCQANFFRMLGIFSSSFFYAQQIMSALFVLLFTYTGFFIPYQKMHPWFQWIHWVDVFGYSFSALYINEMRGLVFDCSKVGTVPAGPTYTDMDHKACVLAGSTPGSPTVTGDQYLKAAYDLNSDNLGLYIMALILFWLLFLVIDFIGLEYVQWVKGGFIKRVYRHGNAPKIESEADEKENQRLVAQATENLGSALQVHEGTFLWQDIKYTVKIPKGTKKILEDVEGWIKPGQMTALMGASGAGKTTLLDVLAQRKTLGVVEGTMLLNGLPLRVDFERITGYVEQMDVHDPYLTVREALRFSAKLRQERNVPIKEKFDYVERVLQMMEMSHMGDALIGSVESGLGISVEERKRLTIGMELVAKPHILFLDEPTSGLDAQSSYNIVKFIRKLADAGMPLVCTIHQPSSVLFEYFDRLLLLAKGGKTVYFGDIGENSSVMIEYFEKNGARKCDHSENPAEYILEVTNVSKIDWPGIWLASEERTAVHDELDVIRKEAEKKEKPKDKATEYATRYSRQTLEVYKKLNLDWWRNPMYNFARILQASLVGLVLGFSFWDLGNSSTDLQLRLLASFQILMLGMLLIMSAMPTFMAQRELFRKDYASKFYSPASFSIGIIFVELPYLATAASLCCVAIYWSANLDSTPIHGFYFWIMFVVFMFFCVSFGQLIAAISPNFMVAMSILPILITILIQNAGVLNPPKSIPKFWKSWVYYINPYHYFMEGVVSVVLDQVPVICNEEDFFTFSPVNGTNCEQYTQAFFDHGATGYIADGNATDVCKYCQYQNGREWLEGNELDVAHSWRNFGIILGFWGFNVLLSCLLVYLFRKARR
eukprot:TRINITY_DN464_c0_g2_i1.p1 TRINITY_DN464_c0_g2~~TRINITY_DN464_c0_g2_i1.p1  ORF type:complete len:1450 (+),score=441.85 TRINITY_DN464_c0_g2_i1:26-4351(+)